MSKIHPHVKRGLSKYKGLDSSGNPNVPVTKIFVDDKMSGAKLYLLDGLAVIGTRDFINAELAASKYPELKNIRLQDGDLVTCEKPKDISKKIKAKI